MANAIRKTTTSIAMKMPAKHIDSESQVSTAVDLGTCIIDIGSMCKRGQLNEALGVLHQINQKGISVDFNTYASLLQACGNAKTLTQGKQVHAHMLKYGVEINLFLAANLVSMYANSGSFVDARSIFDKISGQSVFAWNAMIRGYAIHGNCEEALKFYRQMETGGMLPDKFTFPFVLKACVALQSLTHGFEIHRCIVKSGLESDLFVGSALIDMYSKFGRMDLARTVFDKMSQRDLVLWTAMIAGYAQNGSCDEACKLFHQMGDVNLRPNIFS